MNNLDKPKIQIDKYLKIVFPLFKNVCLEFEKIINNFSFKKYEISDFEIVYQIEDDLILYISLNDNFTGSEEETSKKEHAYYFHDKDITMLYHVYIEELTENRIFNFNYSSFRNKFSDQYFIRINTFKGNKEIQPLVYHVDKNLPQIKLLERVSLWEGWKYNFVVFEITDFTNKKSFGVWSTPNKDFHLHAIEKCKKIEEIIYKNAAIVRGVRFSSEKTYGILFDENIKQVSDLIINHDFKNGAISNLYNNIKYFIVEKNIKHKADIRIENQKILNKAQGNFYVNYVRGSYIEPVVRWKSEFLTKTLCEKIFGRENVIYQHRPYFLHSEGGQLSYDIYITKLKIAIEYQGKQHFEPVDYFGGNESFKKQVHRDKLKMELSKKHGVKLIYINYWEKITEDLITTKIKWKVAEDDE